MLQARLLDHTLMVRALSELPRNGIPEGVRLSGAPLLWAAGYDGRGEVIANIDSGVDAKHPDLQTCPDGSPKILSCRDYVNGDGSLQPGSTSFDYNGHGTHTAGTQAANGQIKGVAPGAQIRVYKVLNARGAGQIEHITRAIDDAVADGCRILSMSLGTTIRIPEWTEAIRRADAAGCLVIVAAGNSGPGSILWPAYEQEVISVGAVGIDPDTGELVTTYFSTANPEVDLAAHGYQVLSTMPGGGYGIMTGTSMACPHVAGKAAIMLQLGKDSLGVPMSGVAAWEGIKTRSVRFGTQEQTGAGFATFYPTLPITRKVQFTFGEKGRWVDGQHQLRDEHDREIPAPILQDGRGFTPPRFSHEPLGGNVGYNGATETITITRRLVLGMDD
jgi:major intracellular serine protease